MPDKDARVESEVIYGSREQNNDVEEHKPLLSSCTESSACNGVKPVIDIQDRCSERNLDHDLIDSDAPLLPEDPSDTSFQQKYPPTIITITSRGTTEVNNDSCRPKVSVASVTLATPGHDAITEPSLAPGSSMGYGGGLGCSNGGAVAYVSTAAVASSVYSTVPTMAPTTSPAVPPAVTCEPAVTGAVPGAGVRKSMRLQGPRHVFTIVPVGSGDHLASQVDAEDQVPLLVSAASTPSPVMLPSVTSVLHPAVTTTPVPGPLSADTPVPLSAATTVPLSVATTIPLSVATTVPLSVAATVPLSAATTVPLSVATTVPLSAATAVLPTVTSVPWPGLTASTCPTMASVPEAAVGPATGTRSPTATSVRRSRQSTTRMVPGVGSAPLYNHYMTIVPGVGSAPPYNHYMTMVPGVGNALAYNQTITRVAPPCIPDRDYNPYHTITGMVPSAHPRREYGVGGGYSILPQREYGVGSSPLYQRGEYGIGSGVPESLMSVVRGNNSPGGSIPMRRHLTRIAPSPFTHPLAFSGRQGSPAGCLGGATPEHPTVNSLNQMTVQSGGAISIEVGSTDGRSLTVRGAVTSPDQLPYLPAVFRHGQGDDVTGLDDEGRQTWGNKAQFVLACIGYAVGLGNLWRFPYLCYKSGGGAFLIPYFLMLFLCGIPLLLMELVVGQYTRRGPIGALQKICPIFKGAGVGTVIMSFLLSTYYNVIIAWAIFYLFQSFTLDLPWRNCNTTWAANCFDNYGANVTAPNGSKSATEEFFDQVVLQKSIGIESMGTIRVELVFALLGAWALVYFSLWKSIKSSGKVVYVTATLPYLLIGAFLWRALTLPGANIGLRYFFSPRWELLLKAEVWVNAAAQNFNSIGIAFGSLIAFSSYNKFNNNIVLDTWAISLTNSFTSLLSGMIVFSTLGNIALEQGKKIDDVVAQGPGLVFMVYPQALAKMPYASLWAILFFFMLLILGLDSQFATVEVIITSLQDGFPKWIQKYLRRHEFLVLIVCFISFLFGLPNVMQGGIYFFQLIDYYAAAVSLMYLAFFEVIAIVWFYGAGRLSRNLLEMTGKTASLYFRFCWYGAAPVLILAIWIFSMVDYKPPTYNKGEYTYPGWAIGIGWCIAGLSILPIPIFAVVAVVKAKGSTLWEKLCNSTRSQIEECPCCGRAYNCLDGAHNAGDDSLHQVKLVMYNPPAMNGDAKSATVEEKEEETANQEDKSVA